MAHRADTPTTPAPITPAARETDPALSAPGDTTTTGAIPDAEPPKRTKVRTRLPKKKARRTLFGRVLDAVTTTKLPPGMGFAGE